jgi:site-specific DNA-methyltransferase (adenine-specific)
MKRQLIHGDSVKELKKFDDNSIDLLCTDPPYGYGFMGRDWDKVLPDIKIFEECFRVLKPGSMAFVMSAPRSDVQYRMAEMLEKVGFRIDYTPIYWTYASGFPKAMNISKMIDKQKGVKGKVVGKRKVTSSDIGQSSGWNKLDTDRGDYEYTKPATDEAKELDGSYAGFQPKPAVEVVIVAMKPLDKKGYLEQAQDNGKGVTWFNDCRIPFEESDTPQGGYGAMDIGIGKPGETQDYRKKKKITMPDLRDVGKKSKEAIGIDKLSYGQVENAERLEYEQNTDGRFPANLLVSDNIIDDGKIRTAKPHGGDGKPLDTRDMGWGFKRMASSISDSGGYSRYYSLDAWFEKNLKSLPEPVQQTFPFMIVPKASRSEKDNGLEFMEEKKSGAYVGRGGSQEDPNGMFKDRETKSRNIHPTVKPLTLMNYLVVLGSRKGDVVLEPFAGSGTTALACVSQERDYIAIEREEEYYDIAKARLEKVEEPIKLWEKFSG